MRIRNIGIEAEEEERRHLAGRETLITVEMLEVHGRTVEWVKGSSSNGRWAMGNRQRACSRAKVP
jgi:hypothetical protein